MKRETMICMMAALCLGNGMTAYATPKAGGSVFDAEYYVQNNPDVVAELGMGENALYAHYVT